MFAKYQVLAQLCLCQVRWEMDKSERVEGQASLHTADLLTNYVRLPYTSIYGSNL